MDGHGNRSAVVLFCGDPRREERQKNLPPRFLGTLHRELRAIVASLPDVDLVTASRRGDELVLTGPGAFVERTTRTLAEQIDLAIRSCFDSGYSRVVILAGDVPTLSREVVADALDRLRSAGPRAVIGPSGDGGFYLAGFNRTPELEWPRILEEPERVAATLAEHAAAARMLLEILPVIDDIDERADAARLLPLRRTASPFSSIVARLSSLLLSRFTPHPDSFREHAIAAPSSVSLRAPPLHHRSF
ncbi:MAG TPA: DUF2064 domain-containing protein [Thermoanaerobaculia bacterium]|nr:DUF2064 domain-containing protein [Thermoanaerobaculia bacterium]